MIPLQFISPNPLPLLFFKASTSGEVCKPILPESYTLASKMQWMSASESPGPLSCTEISTYSSASRAKTLTSPPRPVYLRAFSIKVFIMKSVSALSAFTQTSAGSTISVCSFASKFLRPFCTTSNKGAKLNDSTCRLNEP